MLNELDEVLDGGNLEVEILGVNVVWFKFVVEVGDGEGMFEGVRD